MIMQTRFPADNSAAVCFVDFYYDRNMVCCLHVSQLLLYTKRSVQYDEQYNDVTWALWVLKALVT